MLAHGDAVGRYQTSQRTVDSVMRPLHLVGAVVAALLGACREAPPPPFVPPTLTLVPVPELRIESPVGSDCNRPSFWVGDTFYQIVSNQHAWRSNGGRDAASAQQFTLARFGDDDPAFVWSDSARWYLHDINSERAPTRTSMRWIESVYRRPSDGVLFGLYHTEEGPYVKCGAPYERPYLSVPHIGLARSTNDGQSWRNLGIVLSDGSFPISCDLPVRFFAGGVGDPSMAVGPDSAHLYIVFTDYSGGEASTQGIQIARIAMGDLDAPLTSDGTSKVTRWYRGAWTGPGLQGQSSVRVGQSWPAQPLGQATPLLAPARSWQRADGGEYWGPSLSWNTHLNAFVLLLNKVSGAKAFDAEGNYITYLPDIERPQLVPAVPQRLQDLPGAPQSGWYVQLLGDPRGKGTSALAGQDARLFVGDRSQRLLRFELGRSPSR
jgi:hypothetical protein